MAKVNIDALVPRKDFEDTGSGNQTPLFQSLSVSNLGTNPDSHYPFFSKPDFQRETSEWSKEKIYDFLDSYASGNLIPSIILWRSKSGQFFVIDGAHRLSALASWIYNDYGDGEISQKFYNYTISDDQKKIAREARTYIHKRMGSYQEVMGASESNPKFLEKKKNILAFTMNVQWVPGDAKNAEESFFKINQQGAPLNKTELRLLKSRKKANCIAARIIMRGGEGHKYWENFRDDNQQNAREISHQINELLFTPPLQTPVKSLDFMPIGGKISSAQTLPLIFDSINIVNRVPADYTETFDDDTTGDETVKHLKAMRKMVWRINSVQPSSLGLHPVVYLYSLDGRHKTASFYAMAAWLLEMEQKNSYNDFIKVRASFEDLLLKYDYLIRDLQRYYRQATNSYPHIKDFYNECIAYLLKGMTVENTINEVLKLKEFNFLKLAPKVILNPTSPEFSDEKKSAVFIKDALTHPIRCKICEGLIGQRSMTTDHITRKEDGGIGEEENGQLAHPYCNGTFKEQGHMIIKPS